MPCLSKICTVLSFFFIFSFFTFLCLFIVAFFLSLPYFISQLLKSLFVCFAISLFFILLFDATIFFMLKSVFHFQTALYKYSDRLVKYLDLFVNYSEYQCDKITNINCVTGKNLCLILCMSSIVNEGIKAILNLFILSYKKISHAQKAQNAYKRTKTKKPAFLCP